MPVSLTKAVAAATVIGFNPIRAIFLRRGMIQVKIRLSGDIYEKACEFHTRIPRRYKKYLAGANMRFSKTTLDKCQWNRGFIVIKTYQGDTRSEI